MNSTMWNSFGIYLSIFISIFCPGIFGRHRQILKGSDVLDLVPLIDGHNDLPQSLYLLTNNDLSIFPFERNTTTDEIWGTAVCDRCHTDLPRLRAGKVKAQFWSAYVRCEAQYKDAVSRTLRQIDVIKRLIKKYPDDLEFVDKADDIEKVWKKGKIASLIGIESGHLIDSSLAVLRQYYELGGRYLTLTHSCVTPWADPSQVNDSSVHNLTEFGKITVWEMNRLGMMVDLAHVSHNVMRNVLDITKAPIIFSHSSAFSVCRHYRNVPDDVLLRVKENNGIVMVNFYSVYVNCDGSRNATLEDAIAHINHIRKLIGPDHVGIGGDYSGVKETPVGLEDVSKYPAVFDRLYENKGNEPRWSREDLEKLAGKNLIRVFRDIEKVRDSLADQQPYENVISTEEVARAEEREGMKPGACQTGHEWDDISRSRG